LNLSFEAVPLKQTKTSLFIYWYLLRRTQFPKVPLIQVMIKSRALEVYPLESIYGNLPFLMYSSYHED